MITQITDKFNTLTQNSYDKFIQEIDIKEVVCPNCGLKCFIYYGTYKRSIYTIDGKITLNIQRVRCNNCFKTHAILPIDIIPYSQVPLIDQIHIALNKDTAINDLPHLDLNHIKYIYRIYFKKFKKKIGNASNQSSTIQKLILKSLHTLNNNYMQNHQGSFHLIT